VLSQVDALSVATVSSAERGLLPQLYRRLLERPNDMKVVEARAPIAGLDRKQTLGFVQLAETAERSLALRDKALTQLLDFTLITSALAVTLMFTFAAWLAVRLARLRRASESALTREGLVTTFPETGAPDELGDVARSFSLLLGRLNEYTGYLRTLAGKLAHEIRTPLTIVRSSLDNLESEQVTPAARTYLNRAREGSERLNAILVAMGAATRVEEAIQGAERSRFDLRALMDSAAGAYSTGFPQRQFAAELPDAPVMITGAPDLIVQMLDKLVDNAVDFSPDQATITLRLVADATQAVIEVDNPGPALGSEGRSHLFESLWQSRSGADSRPHFGLGLYIVRLIAEFHGGSAAALNLPDGRGARFRVLLSSTS
jgi:signal transduction histidine kinase